MQLDLEEIELIRSVMPMIGDRINAQIQSITVLTDNGHILLQKYEKNLQVYQQLHKKLTTFFNYDIEPKIQPVNPGQTKAN